MSLLLFSLIIIFTSYISNFFNQIMINEILPYMALTIVANGFRCVHSAILLRNLEFKKLTVISLISVIIGSVIGVIFAYLSEPITGLILVYTLTPILNTIFLWLFAPWGFYFYCKPSLIFSDIKFSLNVTISSGFDQAAKAAMVFLLNGRYGVVDLGYYSRADAIKNISSQTIDKIVQRVSFPVLSKKSRLSQEGAFSEHIKISYSLLLILLPLTYILSVFADNIILIIYGPNWSESSLILEKIAFVGMFFALTSQNITLLKSLKYVNLMTLNKALTFLLLPFTFYIYESSDLLLLLKGIIFYSLILYLFSCLSLFVLSLSMAITYIKFMVLIGSLSTIITYLHNSFIFIQVKNIYFNLIINTSSLILAMILIYYLISIFLNKSKNV